MMSGQVVTTANREFGVTADGVRVWFMIIVTASSTPIILMWVE
jgi:hypothetical protein